MAMKKPKTIKFTLEFEKPSSTEVLKVACPTCYSLPEAECRSYSNTKRPPHHDRYAEFLNLEIVHKSSLYRIKP